jgi:hypothetical protein
VRRLAPALLALLLTTSCAVDRGDPVSDTKLQNAALQERPTHEQEQVRLLQVRDQVRDALASRLGLTDWGQADVGTTAGCADYPDSDGLTAFLPLLALTGGVPDQQWAQAVQVVEEVAGETGFGAARTVVDRPGEHEVVLRGERESLLRFGTLQNATLRLETGCHLTQSNSS